MQAFREPFLRESNLGNEVSEKTMYEVLMDKKRIAIISTGGTIEKTYDAMTGVLANKVNILDIMLESLVLNGVDVVRIPLMNKDSLDMSAKDHTLICETAEAMARPMTAYSSFTARIDWPRQASNVTHMGTPPVPIILTGAMQPYELRHTDAVQNLTEALLAVQIVPPGIYVAMHNKVLQFPGVEKDLERGTFVKKLTEALQGETQAS